MIRLIWDLLLCRFSESQRMKTISALCDQQSALLQQMALLPQGSSQRRLAQCQFDILQGRIYLLLKMQGGSNE